MTEDRYAHAAKMFDVDTAEHEMTILLDQGHHRHLRFMRPKGQSSAYWYDLITVPGALIFRGDYESLVFSREPDMFGFFRSNPDRETRRISPHYWSQKLTSGREQVKSYSEEKFKQLVKEATVEAIRYHSAPRGIGKAIREQILNAEDIHYEDGARRALEDFDHGAKIRLECVRCHRRETIDADDVKACAEWRTEHYGHTQTRVDVEGFKFPDAWEWDLKDFDHSYLWACHAIVTGIARYDAAKAAETPVEPRAWILDSPHVDPTIRIYTTEAAARLGAEQYVSENAARQPITDLEWRPVDDGATDGLDGFHELWGKVDGRMYPAQMIVYSLPVLDTPGSDGDHETT